VADKHRLPTTYPAAHFLDELRRVGWHPGAVPETVILTYARFELYLGTRPDLYTPNHMLGIGPGRFFTVNDSDGRVAVNCLGIGGPAAVAQIELQAALGVQTFLSIGTAGGFQLDSEPGDTVLLTGAIRDEGTSFHYLAPDVEAVPDAALTERFGAALSGAGIEHRRGRTDTTDAPHRTTAAEITQFRDDGVLAVEMEAASIFAVCQAFGLPSASAVVLDGVAQPDATWKMDLGVADLALRDLFAATVAFASS